MNNLKLLATALALLCCSLFQSILAQTKIGFSFNLGTAGNTSAGVYTKDKILIKTLWNLVHYNAGAHTSYWDGTGDDGKLAPEGSYDILVLSSNVVYTWEGVIGNTSTASTGSTVHHAFQRMYGMAISGSTAYYTVNYNEQHTSSFKFNISTPQSKTAILDKGAVTNLVATDGNYVYWNGQDAVNPQVNFVYATKTSDDSEVTNFSSGAPVAVQYTRTYPSAIDLGNNINGKITGLAVQKNGDYLFVAHQKLNELHVLNKRTGAIIRNLSFTSPGSISIDANDNIWMITGTTLSKYNVNADGSLSVGIALSGLTEPLAVAVSPDGNTVAVADGGSSQQVKAYSSSTGNPLWVYGQPGGYSSSPDVSNDKFFFADQEGISTFINFAPDGSFWVGDAGNNRAQHFNAARSFIERIMFMPHFYSTSVDPNNPTRVFVDYLEFSVDYSKPLSPSNNSWTLVKNWGYKVTPEYDGQSKLRYVTTLSNGRTYAFLPHGNTFALVELVSSSGIRFTGIDTPNKSFQFGSDGSFKTVSYFSIGNPSIWKNKPLIGFDGSNNPIWGADAVLATSPPATSNDPHYYGHGGTVLTSSGIVVFFDAGIPPYGGNGYHLGAIKANDNKWLWRTAKSTFKGYDGPFPADGSYDIGNNVQYGGNILLGIDRNVIWGYNGEFWKSSQTNKWNHVYDNGLSVGQFGTTGRDVLGQEAPAMMAGNSFAGALVKGTNGDFYLYHNDESYHSGIHRWRISNMNTINEQTIPVSYPVSTHGLMASFFEGTDLNNINRKTLRIDPVVDFNWPGIPGGTALSTAANYSVSWSGFVKPSVAGNYVFYTNTDEKVRLWIDDSLVIDQWKPAASGEFASTAISLAANIGYSIRMEYANTNGSGRASLLWSGNTVSKQIIPTQNLYPANQPDTANGIDLMEGLPFSKILENNMYGWERNPVNEDYQDPWSKTWTVKTNVKTYSKLSSPDVYMKFAQPGGTYTVKRNLGTPVKGSITTWKIAGNLSYDESNNENSSNEAGGTYFEVLDASDKIITRFYTGFLWNASPVVSIYGNGTLITQGASNLIRQVISKSQPIQITVSNGMASFTYGNYAPIAVPIFDPLANWDMPKTMRIYFWTNGANYPRVMDIEKMRFSKNNNASVNLPPIAIAGTDITLTLPANSTTLNGTGVDPDGTIASYAWSRVSGPTTFTFGSAGAASTTLSNLVQGTYVFRLTVTDNSGATATDDITVIVNAAPNQLPTANAGNDITLTLPTNTTTLSGGGTDTDGTIASHAWSRISGPTSFTFGSAGAASTTLSNLVQGTYVFRLTVTDNSGATATDDITVIVNAAPNQLPTANVGTDITLTLPTNTTTLNGTGADTDGTIASYAWSRVSGPTTFTFGNAGSASTALSNLVQGTYVFRLTVTDNSGATAIDAITVIVNAAPNQLPTANAGTDITLTLPTNTTTLNGTGADTDGTIASYAWSRVSSPTTFTFGNANTASTALSNLVQGTYVFRLTVTDNSGATATDDMTVIVNAAPNQLPTANAGTDITLTLPTNSTTLSGSGADTDGTLASYAWSRVSGPTTFTFGSANTASTVLSNLVQGTYVFRLTAMDNSGATATDDITVIVNAAPNQLPTANAGTDITLTLPTNTTTLNGTGADPDGTIASYAWSRVSGPTTFTFGNANTASTALSNLVQGTYVFRLTVTDNSGATATDDITVIVNAAPNQLPTANAGTDITLTLPTNSTTLSGSGADTDGTIASYAWSRVSGPTTFTFGNAGSASTALSNLVQGTYVFRLTVTDNSGATAIDAITVIVNAAPNQLPTANAGTDITLTLPTNTTTLNGTGADTDGTIASYAWSRVSGPTTFTFGNANTASTALSNLVQGTYVFRLTVTDNSGATATDDMTVIVNAAPNQLPTANAGTDITLTLPTNTTTLNGTGADPDGTIASYAWSRVSGPTTFTFGSANTASTVLSNLVQGTYVFRLTAMDNSGATATDDITVIVNAAPNQLPTANAGTDITLTLPTNTTTLNGTGADPDGTIASYAWSRVSGPTTFTFGNANTASTALSNLVQGTYVFRLTVTDNSGATATDDITVIVNAAPNQLPTANAGSDITLTLPTNTTTLNGTGADPDGTIASYAWSRISGPTTFTFGSANAASSALSNLVQGTYVFRLTVTDNNGATATDDITVIVNAAPNQLPTANAGSNITLTLPANSTTLNGTGADPDGTIASHAWSRISGPTTFTFGSANTASTALSNLVQGTYVFRLTITDNRGAIATDEISVIVNPTGATNQAPIANAGVSHAVTMSSDEATLNGSFSLDPDGIIKSYKWEQLSGPSNAVFASTFLATTKVTGFREGDYIFQLTVTDNLNATAKDTVTITVINNFRLFPGDMMLYPNPATDKITFSLYSERYSTAKITIYDIMGRKVMPPVQVSNSQYRFTKTIDIHSLKPGVYLVDVILNNQKRITLQFIKQ